MCKTCGIACLTLLAIIVDHTVAPRPVVAQDAAAVLEPIRYTLRFPEPQTHFLDVEAVLPTGRRPQVDLMMAVWTPGSYLVREYSRQVTELRASAPDGTLLPIATTRKNHWRVTTNGAASIRLRYKVYCHEMSVRTNWVESQFAVLNGAPTFISLLETASRPHDVRLELPEQWHTSVTALPPAADAMSHHYVAPDYDTLVDSPFIAGTPKIYPFEVVGKPLALVNLGEAGVWDGKRSADDVQAVAKATMHFWGSLPFDSYLFLNVITETSGAIEHKTTLVMTGRWRTSVRADYLSWLRTLSHEFFHTWNGKRLRPVELGPFDYDNEVYTRNLWIYEGFTNYYGPLLVRRAGVSSDGEFLNDLANTIRTLQTTPGRLQQSASQASFDAWIRLYRPDENSPNVSVSYYTKGNVIAFLLDARIRRATGGAKSLDDVLRLAFSRYSGARGYTTDEFRRTASEVAGADLGPWFADVADGTGELDYAEALSWFGLRFRPAEAGAAAARPWLGLGTRNDAGRLLVTQVRRGTPGFAAGVNVDDEILAIDDFRIRGDQFQSRLDLYHPNQQVTLLVARREQLVQIPVTIGSEPVDLWRLEVDPNGSAEHEDRRRAWLTGTRVPE